MIAQQIMPTWRRSDLFFICLSQRKSFFSSSAFWASIICYFAIRWKWLAENGSSITINGQIRDGVIVQVAVGDNRSRSAFTTQLHHSPAGLKAGNHPRNLWLSPQPMLISMRPMSKATNYGGQVGLETEQHIRITQKPQSHGGQWLKIDFHKTAQQKKTGNLDFWRSSVFRCFGQWTMNSE